MSRRQTQRSLGYLWSYWSRPIRHKMFPKSHATTTWKSHIHTHVLTYTQTDPFPQLLAPRGGSCPARMAALTQPETCYVGSPIILLLLSSAQHKVRFRPLSSNFLFNCFLFVSLSPVPSSLFLFCLLWLENLANLDSNNGLYGVLFYCLLIHIVIYWTLFS